jgi:hypothetical protein
LKPIFITLFLLVVAPIAAIDLDGDETAALAVAGSGFFSYSARVGLSLLESTLFN